MAVDIALAFTFLLASCGGTSTVSTTPVTSEPAGTTAATTPAPDTKFDTAKVPGLTVSPQDVYEQATFVCGLKSARGIAADLGMQTSNRERIAARYGRGYNPAVKEAARAGCDDGLAAYARKHSK